MKNSILKNYLDVISGHFVLHVKVRKHVAFPNSETTASAFRAFLRKYRALPK